MSILSDTLGDLLSLLFPARCIGCNELLSSQREAICYRCQSHMSSTAYHLMDENLMEEEIKALCPHVQSAAAQFFFVHGSEWRQVIHHIKYHHAWRTAYWLGYNYGMQLLQSPRFQGIDLVVPVPLHPRRLIGRGYNQSELIARGIAKALGIEVNSSTLRRTRYTKSQVKISHKGDRWKNVKGIFALRHAEQLEGRNILLVDDVYTTGATMIGCIDVLSKARNCKIWVATLAISRVEILGKDL